MDHLDIILRQMEFLIVDMDVIANHCPHSRELLNFLLFLIAFVIPIWIFATAEVRLILFPHWQGHNPFHFVIGACSTDIGLEVFPFYALFMILANSLDFEPFLVFIIEFEFILIWFRKNAFNGKDLIALISDWVNEGFKVEIWNYLGHASIGAV